MTSGRRHVARKVLMTLVNPLKWGVIARQGAWLAQTNISLLKDIVETRRFSSNPNTKRYWDKKLERLGDSWRDDHYYYIMDLLPDDEQFTLLDVGCAFGDGCELIRKRFPKARITGADLSAVGIEKAKARGSGVEYMVLDIRRDPIPGDFDFITMVETLEHFEDPLAIVDRCLKNARTAVIVCVPYRQNLSWTVRWGKEHRSTYDEKTFSAYHSRVVRITDVLAGTGNRYIVYEIRP